MTDRQSSRIGVAGLLRLVWVLTALGILPARAQPASQVAVHNFGAICQVRFAGRLRDYLLSSSHFANRV